MTEPLSLYIHIPFCKSRCNYCDFNTFTGLESFIPAYLDALKMELSKTAASLEVKNPVHSIYFGGGTPSLLTAEQFQEILNVIQHNYSVTRDAEITIEMNPGDLETQNARALRNTGINRVSLGMQSGNNEELAWMGRRHSVEQVVKTVESLHAAGFNNLSLDLIFGYPRQTMQIWQESLAKAMSLEPEHLSLYAINIEEETPLNRQVSRGVCSPLSDDLISEMYDYGRKTLSDAGYIHYEISNWSKSAATQSRHNMQYWRILPYLGFGTAAHGYFAHTRVKNVSDIEKYIRKINSYRPWRSPFPASAEVLPISEMDEMKDFVIFGLRMLHDGIDPFEFKQRFGMDLENIFNYQLLKLQKNNMLIVDEKGIIRLNPDKAFVSNQVFVEFI